MSKKSQFKDAIGAIQPNKPRGLLSIGSEPQFKAPLPVENSPSVENQSDDQGKQTQGNSTQGNLPQGNGPCDKNCELPQGKHTQGEVTQGRPPQGNLPQGEIPCSDAELGSYVADKRKRKREELTEAALSSEDLLSRESQERLLAEYLGGNWGRLSHFITRQLKAPSRYGLKLVDSALIMTVYDKTIAQVIPRMFAPITTEDFENETGMDASNIRAALRVLVEKKVIKKITYKNLNFWGLNYGYFADSASADPEKQGQALRGQTPEGQLPQGKQTQGNAPLGQQGNLPSVSRVNYPARAASSAGNYSGISSSKNLKKESKKESLSFESSFPEKFQIRWKSFDLTGRTENSKRERMIFLELFETHGQEFFENGHPVVEFLESHGNGKAGEEGKVHSPMDYLRRFWEHNLARYKAFEKSTEKPVAFSSISSIVQSNSDNSSESDGQTETVGEFDVTHVEQLFSTEAALHEHVALLVEQSGISSLKKSWKIHRWASPVVRSYVATRMLAEQNAASLQAVLVG